MVIMLLTFSCGRMCDAMLNHGQPTRWDEFSNITLDSLFGSLAPNRKGLPRQSPSQASATSKCRGENAGAPQLAGSVNILNLHFPII